MARSAASRRAMIRDFGTRKVIENGESKRLTIPAELNSLPFPNDKGDEYRVLLDEDANEIILRPVE